MSKVGVVWISRHELNERNRQILTEAFGEWELLYWEKETIYPDEVCEIVGYWQETAGEFGYKKLVFVVVLPPDLIANFLQCRAEVYRFVVERKVDEKGDVEFIPIGLEKIIKIEVVTERVV